MGSLALLVHYVDVVRPLPVQFREHLLDVLQPTAHAVPPNHPLYEFPDMNRPTIGNPMACHVCPGMVPTIAVEEFEELRDRGPSRLLLPAALPSAVHASHRLR